MNATMLKSSNSVTTSTARSISEFRTAVNNSFVPLNVTSDNPDHFFGIIRDASVGEIHVSDVRATRHVVERTPELIARADRSYFKVSIMLAGHGLLIQDNREALLNPGDLAVYDTSRPYSLVFDEDFQTMVVMFPRNLLALPPDSIGELTGVRICGSAGVGAIVAPFLAQISSHLDQLAGAAGIRITQSALDLVSTVFINELGLDTGSVDPHRALMQRIRAYIESRLGCLDLTPGSIAAAHFISTRHLHGLFQEEKTTVSTWIRSRRLEQCRRDLIDPTQAFRSISAVSARWGFVDAAHFSRVFKTAYGLSPSEFRSTH